MEEGKDLLCTKPFYYMYLVVKMHVCLIYKSGAKAVLEAALQPEKKIVTEAMTMV